jgi:tRNA-dihydrouridine synthase
VVGNGDVIEADDGLRMFRETGCDGVMIGRASMKNPWIYSQIVELMAGRDLRQPTLEDRRALILGHFRLLMEQEKDPKLTLHKLRTFTGWYTHGVPGGRKLRMKINALTGPENFIEEVEKLFAAGFLN